MRKFVLFLMMFIGVLQVKALENTIPKNTYYEQTNLYAYLAYNEELYNYCVESTCKVYIEYNWKQTDDQIWQKSELIEVNNTNMRNLVVSSDNVYYSTNNLKFSDIVIRARYVTLTDEYEYYEWTAQEGIKVFNFAEAPIPVIENFEILTASETPTIDYSLKNKEEIEEYFKEYAEIYNTEVDYSLEYRINDVAWKDKIDLSTIDLNDVKIEFRLKYNINNYQSNTSNTLIYEVHPEVQTCLFNSDLCCTEILHISLCIWLLSLFMLVVVTLIIIENINRKKREA